MRTSRVKRLLSSYVGACVIVGAAVVFALVKGDWAFAVVWSAYIALMILRYRFLPPGRGRQLHPPNESTIQFLRKRRQSEP